ncbi:MAG: alpha/beta hydrolase [archaeon]|nr:alpha/beta hydrolase [archaeon]
MDIKKIIDSPSVSMRIFYPRRVAPPKEVKSKYRILNFNIADDVNIGGILFLNKDVENSSTMLYFHGNGEIANDYMDIAQNYINCGLNFAVFDFRGYGFSSGNSQYSSLYEDPIILYKNFSEWLENEYSGRCTESIFVMGRSLGSSCASVLGANDPIKLKGIVFESSYGNSYRLMTRLFAFNHPDIDEKSLEQYSNDTYLHQIKKPSLVLHGARDDIIPFQEGNYVYDCIPKEVEKDFIAIMRASHNNILLCENEYFPPIKKFIAKYK